MVSRSPRQGSCVGSTYSLPLSLFGPEELEEEQKRLTLQARTSFGTPPPPFQSWYIRGDMFHVPRFYGLERFGAAERDERVAGEDIDVGFSGALTDVQERATHSVFQRHLAPDGDGGVMISLPCGYGKTVWAVHTIARLRRKACVFVHKAFLRDQWENAFRTFCPGIRIGFIQGKQWKVDDCDVVIAMIMTMAKRNYDPDVMDCFGTICFDECHHVAAPVMNLATRIFRARYVIGLTATKDRPDGLTPLLHWSMGPEAFRVDRDAETVRVSLALFSGAAREITNRDGKPMVSLMVNKLAQHEGRNRFIAGRIVALHRAGRTILVLSDRIAQLDALLALILSAGVPADVVGMFTGATKEADRRVQLARRVVMCSYGMANEGLDKREADTCIMATPKGRVTQCIGRIQRPCATKQPPLVVDIADDAPIFNALRWKRQKGYAKERYEVQVLDGTTTPDEQWFT